MPIYKGSNKIGAIYKGSNKIDKDYKGSVLVYSSAYWLSYSFENLYYSLIPTTVSGKTVQNKLRIVNIEGNSVVENQLVQNGDFESLTGWEYSPAPTISNNIATVTVPSGRTISLYQEILKTSGHKYVVIASIKSSTAQNLKINWGSILETISLTTNWQKFVIFVSTIPGGNNNLNFTNTGLVADSTIDFKNIMVIDLTQMFPFDTPTTLSDVRVQALLNRGYIEYNAGSIESVNISEFSSEPYNLCDETFESGTIYQGSDISSSTAKRTPSANKIEVFGGQSYTIEGDYTGDYFIFEFDSNMNQIKRDENNNSLGGSATLLDNCKYVRLVVPSNATQICFHRTGTRTGYAPYTQPQTLTLHYQGSGAGTAHDTMAISGSNVVFTKNVSSATIKDILPSDNYWSKSSSIGWYSLPAKSIVKRPPNDSTAANILIVGYKTATSAYSSDMTCALRESDGRLWIANSAWSSWTGTQVSDVVKDLEMNYELATPQTITIPLDHCGVVDLGSLNDLTVLSAGTANERVYIPFNLAKMPINSSTVANIYCSKFMSASVDDVYGHFKDNIISIHNSNGGIYLYSNAYIGKTAQEISALLSGIYLYYETTDESDINTQIKIEAGGTITTDSNVLTDVDVEVKCK